MKLHLCLAEQIQGALLDGCLGLEKVLLIDLAADAIPPVLHGRDRRCPCPQEGINNRVAHEAKHLDQAFGQLEGIGCRVVFRGSSLQARPDLLKPFGCNRSSALCGQGPSCLF